MSALVFDLGGTHLRASVAEQGQLVTDVKKSHVQSVDEGAAPETVWEGVVNAILDFAAAPPAPVATDAPLVLSFPGPVSKDGRILDAPTLVGDAGPLPDLRRILQDGSGRNVYLLNDMSAAAWQASRLTEAQRFLVVTVSSGIGSKIFDRGFSRRVFDDVAYAGEIGHVVVDVSDGAPLCDCGSKGHLGAIASGRGINREARRRAHEDSRSFRQSMCMTKFGATVDNLSNEDHLVPAILAGDPWATGVLEDCLVPLARVLATVVVAVGIQQVVIIGGFAQALQETFTLALRNHLTKLADFSALKQAGEPLLVSPPWAEEVCLLGAAVFAWEALGR